MNIKEPLQFQEKNNKSPSQGNTPIPTKKEQPSKKRSSNYHKKTTNKHVPVFREHTHHHFYYASCPKFTKNDSRLTPSRLLPQSPGAAVRHPARPAATFAPRRMGPIKGESVENGKNPLMRVLAAQKNANSFLWKVFS